MGLDRTFTDLDAKFRSAPNLTPEQLATWNGITNRANAKFQQANLTEKIWFVGVINATCTTIWVA